MNKCFSIFLSLLIINIFQFNTLYANDSFYDEKCYLDNNYVLLYKIINWWNDCTPDDEYLLCNNQLKCELYNSTNIKYDDENQLLIFNSKYYIEELISIFSECENCKSHLFKCTYINNEYFGNIKAESARIIDSTINSITINNVSKNQVNRLLKQVKFIKIEIEGKVGGLLLGSGRIALHQRGNFLKKCPTQVQNHSNTSEISITVKNMEDNDIIVKFETIHK